MRSGTELNQFLSISYLLLKDVKDDSKINSKR